MELYERVCPQCHNVIIHKNKRQWKIGIDTNRICFSCLNKNGRVKKFIVPDRECYICHSTIKYKDINSYDQAKRLNKVCKHCAPSKYSVIKKCEWCGEEYTGKKINHFCPKCRVFDKWYQKIMIEMKISQWELKKWPVEFLRENPILLETLQVKYNINLLLNPTLQKFKPK